MALESFHHAFDVFPSDGVLAVDIKGLWKAVTVEGTFDEQFCHIGPVHACAEIMIELDMIRRAVAFQTGQDLFTGSHHDPRHVGGVLVADLIPKAPWP